jgi:protein TonB
MVAAPVPDPPVPSAVLELGMPDGGVQLPRSYLFVPHTEVAVPPQGMSRPPYPPESTVIQEEGRTLLHLEVNEDGWVIDATVVDSSGFPRLDKAAVEWARTHWRFMPAVNHRRRIAGSIDYPVVWRLKPAPDSTSG